MYAVDRGHGVPAVQIPTGRPVGSIQFCGMGLAPPLSYWPTASTNATVACLYLRCAGTCGRVCATATARRERSATSVCSTDSAVAVQR